MKWRRIPPFWLLPDSILEFVDIVRILETQKLLLRGAAGVKICSIAVLCVRKITGRLTNTFANIFLRRHFKGKWKISLVATRMTLGLSGTDFV